MVAYAQPVELFYDSDWHEITEDVRDDIVITRGAGADTQFAPSSMSCTIDNLKSRVFANAPDEVYSPLNVDSPLFGKIGKNTPIRNGYRALVDDFSRTVASGWGTAPDGQKWTAATVGTGSSSVGSGVGIHTQSTANGYRLQLLEDVDGNRFVDSQIRTRFTVQLSDVTGAAIEPANLVLRATDLSNYYFLRISISTAEVVTISIRRLVGGVEATLLPTSVTLTDLTFTGQELAAEFGVEGHFLYAKVWDPEVGEPLRPQLITADRNHTSGVPGVRTGRATGNTNADMTVHYESLEVRIPRYIGEIERWPQRSNIDDSDVWVPIKAFDVTRRMIAKGKETPARSALRRAHDVGDLAAGLVAFWALDDARSGDLTATTGTFDLVAGYSARPRPPSFAHFALGGAAWSTDVPPSLPAALKLTSARLAFNSSPVLGESSPPGFPVVAGQPLRIGLAFRLAERLPDAPNSAGEFEATILRLVEPGANNPGWGVRLITSSSGTVFRLNTFHINTSGSVNHTETDTITIDTNEWHYLTFTLTSASGGSNTSYRTVLDDTLVNAGTGSGIAFADSIDVLFLNVNQDVPGVELVGGLSVWSGSSIPDEDAAYEAFLGHAGESTWARAERIATEEGMPFSASFEEGPLMGPQRPVTPFESILEAAEAEGAVVFAARGFPGIAWLGFDAIGKPEAFELDYTTAGDVGHPINAPDDTAGLTNHVTIARRPGGAEVLLTKSSGANNTSDPADDPKGVGRYATRRELSLSADTFAGVMAARRLRIGSWPDTRYVGIQLQPDANPARSDLFYAKLSMDVGRRLTIINTPARYGPGPIDQVIRGLVEEPRDDTWLMDINTVPAGPYLTKGLSLTGSSGDYASTPDAAALDITGDMCLACEATFDWGDGAYHPMIHKWDAPSAQSYGMAVDESGSPAFVWTTDGTDDTLGFQASAEVVPFDDGERGAVAAAIDVNNGASGHTIRYYTAPGIDGPWTLLETIVTAGTTSIFSGAAPVEVGTYDQGVGDPWAGVIHAIQIRSGGIDGTVVLDARFQEQAPGATSFVDETGRTWTVHGDAEIL